MEPSHLDYSLILVFFSVVLGIGACIPINPGKTVQSFSYKAALCPVAYRSFDSGEYF